MVANNVQKQHLQMNVFVNAWVANKDTEHTLLSLGNTPCFVAEATPLLRSPGNYKIHCHAELIVF